MHTGRKRPNLESSLDMSWGGADAAASQWPSPPRPGDDHSYELDDSTDDFRMGAGGLGSTAPAALFGSRGGSGGGSPSSPSSPRGPRPKSSADAAPSSNTLDSLRIRAGGVMGHNIGSVTHLTPSLDEGINWASSAPSTPQGGSGVPTHPHVRGRSDSALSDVSRASRKRDAHDVSRRNSGSVGQPSSPFAGPVVAPSEPRVLAHRRSSNASAASTSSRGGERHQDTMASTWGSLTSQGQGRYSAEQRGDDSDEELVDSDGDTPNHDAQSVIWEFNLAGMSSAARQAQSSGGAGAGKKGGAGDMSGGLSSVPTERSAPVVAGVTPRSRRGSENAALPSVREVGHVAGVRLPTGSPAVPGSGAPVTAGGASIFSPGGVNTPAPRTRASQEAFTVSAAGSHGGSTGSPHHTGRGFRTPGPSGTPGTAPLSSAHRSLPERSESDLVPLTSAATDEVELDLSTSFTALSLDEGASGGADGALSVVGTSMKIHRDDQPGASSGMPPPGKKTPIGVLWGSGEVIDGLIVTDDGTDIIHDLNVPDASEVNTSGNDLAGRSSSPYGTLGIGGLSGAPSTFQSSPSRRDDRISLQAATGGVDPPLPSFHSLSGDIAAFSLGTEGATDEQLASAAATLAAAAAAVHASRGQDTHLEGSTSLDVSL